MKILSKKSLFLFVLVAFISAGIGLFFQIKTGRLLVSQLNELIEISNSSRTVKVRLEEIKILPILGALLGRLSFENDYFQKIDSVKSELTKVSNSSFSCPRTVSLSSELLAAVEDQAEVDTEMFDLSRKGESKKAEAIYNSVENEASRFRVASLEKELSDWLQTRLKNVDAQILDNNTWSVFYLVFSFLVSLACVFFVVRKLVLANEHAEMFGSRLEMLVAERTSELKRAQEVANIGSWNFDIETKNQVWSDQHYQIFEIPNPQPPDELYRMYRERIHSDDLKKLDEFVHRALNYGEDFVFDHRVVLNQGSKVKHVRGIGKVNKNSQGKPVSISGTCQDITELMEMQKQLEVERAKAFHSSKLASLGEMSAGIAHEINNPLAVISGTIPLLNKFKLDDSKFTSKLETMTKSALRIEKIVKGLKKFSRASTGAEFKLEKVQEIINEALVITEAKSRRHATPISVTLDAQLEIVCDQVEIEQVLVNLINNGIDAVKNETERWIKVNAFARGNSVVLQVIDSGNGISEDLEQKLFQPFFTTKAVGEGTGLGLSVAKGILDSHKATFGVNREFRNTCFEIVFKAASEAKVAA